MTSYAPSPTDDLANRLAASGVAFNREGDDFYLPDFGVYVAAVRGGHGRTPEPHKPLQITLHGYTAVDAFARLLGKWSE